MTSWAALFDRAAGRDRDLDDVREALARRRAEGEDDDPAERE